MSRVWITDGDTFREAAIGPLRMSDYFLIIGSEHYIKSLEEPHDVEHLVLLSQIMAAKDANKPVIILWVKGVSELSKSKLRMALKGMNLIGEHECLPEEPVPEDVAAVTKMMEEHPI